MTLAIEVAGISKCFLINHATRGRQGDYRTLRESISGAVTRTWQNLRRGAALGTVEEFWALRDVSFDVRPGEVIGLIGRNGAGKSTLLKILTRITEPTSGRAVIRGRVGSLLEVGTGFHPELTGRENIFLNGSILGMTRREIKKNFDQIVEFSGVEQFIDTPVKRYSSGMKVRLAFSIAAHLDLEVMLVDEVLAVGDAEFQRKCLGRINDVSKSGRTILFVSHNMGAVAQLCSQSVWLDGGRVHEFGPTQQIISDYMQTMDAARGKSEATFQENSALDVQVMEVRLLDQAGHGTQAFECDRPIVLEFDLDVRRPIRGMYGYLSINTADGLPVMVSDSFDAPPNPLDSLPLGRSIFRVTIPPRTLAAGRYGVYFSLASRGVIAALDIPGVVCQFSLDDHSSRRGNARLGHFSTMLNWKRVSQQTHPPLDSESSRDKTRLTMESG